METASPAVPTNFFHLQNPSHPTSPSQSPQPKEGHTKDAPTHQKNKRKPSDKASLPTSPIPSTAPAERDGTGQIHPTQVCPIPQPTRKTNESHQTRHPIPPHRYPPRPPQSGAAQVRRSERFWLRQKPRRRGNSFAPSMLNDRRSPEEQKEGHPKDVLLFVLLERVTRLELATSTLARWRSTR